ncbi:MAG: hypothetical protein AVDCRST_MAG77-872 [uncultured Chloroflexi bacterium]|uniref:Uncharacterized protein n=1 Tax=uncultured Chloroflexota bacterium TaxID=166587 RepID=A0A6J4HQQ8_9CHLR|nr:MAG: hypothetical protein AVDCRST_MAG77-872 [uncultured Chloroflexota bacterium]
MRVFAPPAGVLAIIAHGGVVGAYAPEPLDGDLMVVSHEHPAPPAVALFARDLPAGQNRALARVVAGHRIGWLRPTVLQQSLLQTGRTVWGDPAALAAVPSWRPDQVDPLEALVELRTAEGLLGEGKVEAAVATAAGALLVARRAYTALPGERAAALARVWPEAPQPWSALGGEGGTPRTPERAFVTRTRQLVEEWLFTWHAAPTSTLVGRLEELRASARLAAVARGCA